MTTLMEEEPFVAVVSNKHMSMTCSKCFAWNLIGANLVNLSRCAGCHTVYYCSKECQKADWQDHKAECKLLRAVTVLPSQDVRMIARILDKSKRCPEYKAFNGRTYDSLMDHVADAKKSPPHMEKIFPLCRDVIAFMGRRAPDMEAVFLAYWKKATNAFGINDGTPGGDFRGVGLYLGLSVHYHACDSECWVVCSGPKLLLRTTNKQMKYSENLTICYPSGDFTRNTTLRRLKLHTSFFFTCMCPECFELELNRNRLAGRSGCCSKGWFPGVAYEFDITEEKWSECGKKVPEENIHKVMEANKKLEIAIAQYDFKPEEVDEFDLIDRYIKLYEDNKEILSEHNVNLIGCSEIIYTSALHRNLPAAVKYVDISLPMIRQRPAGLNRSMGLCRRYMLYDMARKPLGEVRKACEEALETVELVYGEKHELTAQMRLKAMELKFASQFGMR